MNNERDLPFTTGYDNISSGDFSVTRDEKLYAGEIVCTHNNEAIATGKYSVTNEEFNSQHGNSVIINADNKSVSGKYSILVGSFDTYFNLDDDSTLAIGCGDMVMKTKVDAQEYGVLVGILKRMEHIKL